MCPFVVCPFAARAGIVIAAVTLIVHAPPVRACSPAPPSPSTAIPRTSAVNVSTATSIVVLSPRQPLGLMLSAGGQPVVVRGVTALGNGVDGTSSLNSFWRVETDGASGAMLLGQTEYVVSLPDSTGAVSELTRFTTAAGYDKLPGVAPVLRSVRLWRVRYPVKDIGSGNCVFAEYHGFISLDSDPATVPNTPADSVIHTIRLSPKTGGAEQTFLFDGASAFAGSEPTGDYPIPTSLWLPELDPAREYCVTIEAFGDGDLARDRLLSHQVCANVTQISARGAPPPPGAGGCSIPGGPAGVPVTPPVTAALAVLMALHRGNPRRAGRRRALQKASSTIAAPVARCWSGAEALVSQPQPCPDFAVGTGLQISGANRFKSA